MVRCEQWQSIHDEDRREIAALRELLTYKDKRIEQLQREEVRVMTALKNSTVVYVS